LITSSHPAGVEDGCDGRQTDQIELPDLFSQFIEPSGVREDVIAYQHFRLVERHLRVASLGDLNVITRHRVQTPLFQIRKLLLRSFDPFSIRAMVFLHSSE